jgi:predicted glycoside hydrolase/deacetylase ChbG (UPF0249 family)
MRRIAFCADDFGAWPAADRGILALVERGRLGAVSCQVAAPHWPAAAPGLLAHADAVDLGLHLDLAPRRGDLAALILRSHARVLDRGATAARIAAQLDAFERATGRAPQFVDGHQHCHQLPVVRELLLAELQARYAPRVPFVRSTRPRRGRGLKAAVVAALGGAALDRALTRREIPHNADFGGLYELDPAADYPALMRRWLADVADRGLIMCHPGDAPGDPGDPIAAARARELAYLGSEAFPADLAAAGVRPVRPSALTS